MYKKYFVISILTDILAVLMIPIDLFLIQIPEFVMLVFAGLMFGAVVLYFIKVKGKWFSKTVLSMLLIIFLCAALLGSYCNPYWNSVIFKSYSYTSEYNHELSYKEAKSDIDFAMHYIKKDHPLFMQGVPYEIKQQYEKAVDELKSAKTIDTTLLYQKLQNIVSSLNDAHTCVYPYYEEEHYLKYIKARNDAGDNLIKVNDTDLIELLRDKADLYSFEAESWGLRQLKQDLSTLEGLAFLDIPVNSGVNYTYEDSDGNQETASYYKNDFVTYEEYAEYNQIENVQEDTFVYYAVDEEHSLAVLTLNQCNFNEEYSKCLKDMFTEVKDKKIKNVAVDIRNNGGGNSLVANEFIRYLDVNSYSEGSNKWRFGIFNIDSGNEPTPNNKYTDLTFQGDVYVLTSAASFSSAMLFAEFIKDNHLGTIIGEAPGNTPSGYGDIATFRLPHSGLYLQVSTKQFFRADSNSNDILVRPDIECEAGDALDFLYEELE